MPVDFSGYQPENYDRTYSGVVNAEEALIRSGLVLDKAVAEAYADYFGITRLELPETDQIIRAHEPDGSVMQLGRVEDLAAECDVHFLGKPIKLKVYLGPLAMGRNQLDQLGNLVGAGHQQHGEPRAGLPPGQPRHP